MHAEKAHHEVLIPSTSRLEEAYQRTLPELSALPDKRLRWMSVDVSVAAATVLEALPKLRELEEPLAAQWPGFDPGGFDRLEERVRALEYVHAQHQTAPPAERAQLDRRRQQAFTLVFEGYEQARRRVQHLFKRNGDAERIAPSLFAQAARPSRTARRRAG